MYIGLCLVPEALGKEAESDSVSTIQYQRFLLDPLPLMDSLLLSHLDQALEAGAFVALDGSLIWSINFFRLCAGKRQFHVEKIIYLKSVYYRHYYTNFTGGGRFRFSAVGKAVRRGLEATVNRGLTVAGGFAHHG